MQYNQLITDIQADIYSNGAELITGDILQNVLVAMVGALSSAGACYKGTITPASAAPLDLDQATVYLALTAGTYTNFVDSNNDPIVTTGPALIVYEGGPSLVFSKTDLPSGSPDAVLYTPQTLTDAQKEQARDNIEAAHAVRITSADLSTKPYLYIAIPIDSQELNLRIDVVAHNSDGDKIGYTGSLLLALNDDGGGVWTGKQAYYYGDDLALLFSSIAIDVYGDYFLVLACESSNDDITLTIYPTTDTEIAATWYASRPGTEETTITPTAIGAGGVFWATYGTTTATEIATALSAGKEVRCKYGNFVYILLDQNPAYYGFSSIANAVSRVLYCYISDSTWGSGASTLENTSNKVSSIDSTNYNSADKYPSLAALNASLYKWGVISQTQTWSGTGSNPRTYVMSDQVRGLIPQANIDLFVAAGAVFNETSGYFELNGLKDISYEEMQKIYNALTQADSRNFTFIFYSLPIRTNLPFIWYGRNCDGPDANRSGGASLANAFAYSDLEVVLMPPPIRGNTSSFSAISSLMYSAQYIKRIENAFIYSGNAAPTAFAFSSASLEYMHLQGAKWNFAIASSVFEPESVAYIINNVGTTSPITITLHATAYARAIADTDVQTALSAHTNVSLASA